MASNEMVERRFKPRIEGPIPAQVRSTDAGGAPFEIQTMLDNLSVGGFHMRLTRQLEAAVSVSALICFTGMNIEAEGVVKRIEPQPDGSFGFGVEFKSYQILSAS